MIPIKSPIGPITINRVIAFLYPRQAGQPIPGFPVISPGMIIAITKRKKSRETKLSGRHFRCPSLRRSLDKAIITNSGARNSGITDLRKQTKMANTE